MDKQVLLNQAAKAFKLYEDQKAATSRTQDQYQQSLEKEREKVTRLERGKRTCSVCCMITAQIFKIILECNVNFIYSSRLIIALTHSSYINSFCYSRVNRVSRKGTRYIHILQGNIRHHSGTGVKKRGKVATDGRTGDFPGNRGMSI